VAKGAKGSEPNPAETRKDYSDIKGEFGVVKETDSIKDHIDKERNQLTEKLRELESRVKKMLSKRLRVSHLPGSGRPSLTRFLAFANNTKESKGKAARRQTPPFSLRRRGELLSAEPV